MPKGLPASYIKQARRELPNGSWHDIFKRAWQIYKSGKIYKAVSRKRSYRGRKRMPRRRRRYYPRRRRRSTRSLLTTAYKLIPTVALAAPAIQTAMGPQTWQEKLEHMIYQYTGWSGLRNQFEWEGLKEGWTPFLASSLIVLGIKKLRGILRRI